MIASIRSKALKRYWAKGDEAALRADWRSKARRVMAALDAAIAPADMDVPGLGFHALSGTMTGRVAVALSRNWRITFAWDGEDAVDIDLEDYHGS